MTGSPAHGPRAGGAQIAVHEWIAAQRVGVDVDVRGEWSLTKKWEVVGSGHAANHAVFARLLCLWSPSGESHNHDGRWPLNISGSMFGVLFSA